MNPIRVEKTGEMIIPTLDLTGNESKVSKLIVKACEEYGFFKVVNHGIDDHIIKTMENESFEFFNKPLLEKQRAELAKPFGYGNKNIGLSGDTGELEYLLLQANQDFIDNTSMLISNDPSSFSSRVNSYVKAVKGVACNILELMAKGIGGVPHSVFTTLLTEHDSDSLLRLNHYPCVTEDHPFQHGNPVGFGEHSDPQILTLLASNGVPGLQVFLGNSRQWVSVAPDPRAFFVIVGDLLQSMEFLTKPTDIQDQEVHLEVLKVFGRVWRWHGARSGGLAQRREHYHLSTVHFLKFSENSFEVLKILENKLESLKLQENQLVDGLVLKLPENSVEVLKILENKLESMKILENKLESLKLQENQPVDGLVPLSIKNIYIRKCLREAVKESIWRDFLAGEFGGSFWREYRATGGIGQNFGSRLRLETDIIQKDEKQSKKRQNRARNGKVSKDEAKSKPEKSNSQSQSQPRQSQVNYEKINQRKI
ncbi:gibberellin 2-beta-dioxygenase 2-like protein [Tanacetum coccineum]|uniref:Gibberellin 2-beta-dioxygenase 2-like protein n=1 Tax=Tanacetum coccineum TaxID=301880 RepID=A0ABQ4WVC6_9ASTR